MIMKNKQVPNIEMAESPLFWPAHLKAGVLRVLDETLIPRKLHYIKVRNVPQAVKVIKDMQTRAFGQFLVVLYAFVLELNTETAPGGLLKRLEKCAHMLNNSRPTFPFSEVTGMVLHWARTAHRENRDLCPFLLKNINGYLAGIRARRLDRVRRIAELIKDGDSILTHCNVSGELAMAARLCKDDGKTVHFFATETRPYLQGAKLTAWELSRMGADVTLIADNAIGLIMADGLVDKVIVGSDRSCANGDFANKIGTYQIAVLAKEFEIPFYVLTQPSKRIKSGKDIPVEIRDANELLKFSNRKVLSGNVEGFYPGFDIVPNKFITKDIPINVN